MIAVAEPEISVDTDFGKVPALKTDRIKKEETSAPVPVYLADAEEEVKKAKAEVGEVRNDVEKSPEAARQTAEKDTEEKTYFPEDWGEEESKTRRRPATSLVFSGSAATNNTSSAGSGPFRSPSADNIAPSTGVIPKSSESTYGLPVTFGAGVKIGLSPRWSLGTGLNYTLLSRKFFGTYTKVNSGVVEETATSDIRNTQHYIGIPINAYYSIVNKDRIDFYVYGGGAVEKCVSNKYNILNTAYNYTESVKGVQLSAAVGLGVEFILGKNLGLYFDPSLRYSFDCGQPKSIRTARPLMLGIEMGLRINL
jgi:opacity protein-like surface antigen